MPESDARSVRTEERPELENLVVLGRGLRWSSAFSTETGNEVCRKQEAANLRVELSRIRCDERNGPRARSEGDALEVIRGGAEREPGLERWRTLRCVTQRQREEVWTNVGKFCLYQKLPEWTTSRTLFKPGKT